MIIEKLKSNDIPKLLDLYKELIDDENSPQMSAQIYEKMLEDNKYLVLIAKEDEKILGSVLCITCLSLALNGATFLVIEDVIVKDGLRGKGIGKSLMNAADEFAREQKCVYSLLVSSGFRKNAHIFYEKCGYTEDVKGFRKMYETLGLN